MVVYEIDGKPIPWMRSGRKGNKYYDKQIEEKKKVQLFLKSNLCTKEGDPNHSIPIKVTMEFHMPIPKSWPQKRQRVAKGKPHPYRPDLDNLIKFINDTLNNILWIDDSLIYELKVRKFYSDSPKTKICIEKYESEELPNLI